jgi:hypothetical protein
MTTTYDLLYSNVLTTNTTSVTISSISSAYRDLILVIDGIAGNADFFPRIRFNGDTGSNYSWVNAQGTGSSSGSFSGTETGQQLGNAVSFATTTRTMIVSQIMDYSTTDKHKASLTRANRANQATEMLAGRWANTSAITSIQLYSGNGNSLGPDTVIYLYGIVS